jgi:two-component system phosphate regulon sensor histidine kinase PhoR
MQKVAEGFAEGELSLRVPMPEPEELQALARALNKMARQLHERIVTITGQRNEVEAILSSMVEGVIAIDSEGHIVSINQAAAQLLSIDAQQAQGRQVEEVVRDVDLQEFARKTLAGQQPEEADISLPINGGRFFQVHGASLPEERNKRAGAVIVLNDMTRIYRLENIRRDFVANVSHELKTPITSIKGFVEAILEGDITDADQVSYYLKIVEKHADRLNAIIDDLLSLSRLEEDADGSRPSLEKSDVRVVAESAVELSCIKANEKNIRLLLTGEEAATARINAPLLEQAVVNLVDNAIKYSEPDSNVTIDIHQDAEHVTIAVNDRGCGIPKEHMSRLFERFYVVDKGRSRKLGGTGLGLAIVKHIAQVHGGSIAVESELGHGSTFSILLPSA